MRKLLTKTIWAPGIIPIEEWKYRNLKRVVLPLVDMFFVLGGFAVVKFGLPTIDVFFPDYMVNLGGRILSFSAFLALLGVCFPKLWPFEMTGKSILLGLLVGYFVASIWLTAVGATGRGFVLMLDLIAIALVIWRLTLLGSEWQTRRLAVKAALEKDETNV